MNNILLEKKGTRPVTDSLIKRLMLKALIGEKIFIPVRPVSEGTPCTTRMITHTTDPVSEDDVKLMGG